MSKNQSGNYLADSDESREGLIRRIRESASLKIAGGTAMFSAALFGLTGCGGESQEPTHTTAIDAESTSEPTLTTIEQQEQQTDVESLKIDAELMNDPERLSELMIGERISDWFNAGATEDDYEEALLERNVDRSFEDIARDYSAQNSEYFTEALLVSNWQNNAELVKLVDDFSSINANTMELAYLSLRSGLSPYERVSTISEIDGSEVKTDGSLEIVLTAIDTTNLSLLIEENYDRPFAGNQKGSLPTFIGKYKYTFVNENGYCKISDVELLENFVQYN